MADGDTLTARETKNKILADMTADERDRAVWGETRSGGFLIIGNTSIYHVFYDGFDVVTRVSPFDPSWLAGEV